MKPPATALDKLLARAKANRASKAKAAASKPAEPANPSHPWGYTGRCKQGGAR